MGRMLGSPRNRSANKVDNPYDSDGFYQYVHFKGSRKNGAATGGRLRRRALRTKEKHTNAREIAAELN